MDGAVQKIYPSDMLGGQGVDFLRVVAFRSIGCSGSLKSQNTLARSRQLCTQLVIFEGSLAELFCFLCCWLRFFEEEFLSFGAVNRNLLRKCRRLASSWLCQHPLLKDLA